MRFKAVGFDMDGTFLKTRVDYVRLNDVDRTVCLEHGIPFDEIDFGGALKRRRAPILEWLAANGRAGEGPALEREIDELSTMYECQFVDEARPFPGAVECVDEIRRMGLRTGILTRGSREYARRALGPLEGRFDFVMGRDYSSFDEAKPSPVAMRQFCAELGVEPGETLYVGDNVADWMTARDAGAAFVGVLTGTATEEVWRGCDPDMVVIPGVADLPGVLGRLRPLEKKKKGFRGRARGPGAGFTGCRRPACGSCPGSSGAPGRRT